jgi:hypothetical protein
VSAIEREDGDGEALATAKIGGFTLTLVGLFSGLVGGAGILDCQGGQQYSESSEDRTAWLSGAS